MEEDEDDDDGVDEVVEEIEPPAIYAPIVEDVMDGDEMDENEEVEETNDETTLPPPLIRDRPSRNRKTPSTYNPSTGQDYEDGVINLNAESREVTLMTEEETLEHVF